MPSNRFPTSKNILEDGLLCSHVASRWSSSYLFKFGDVVFVLIGIYIYCKGIPNEPSGGLSNFGDSKGG